MEISKETIEAEERASIETKKALCNHNWVYDSRLLLSDPPQQDRICKECGDTDRVSLSESPHETYDEIRKRFE